MAANEPTAAALGTAARRPFVVVHVAVSLDGATTGFPVDVGRKFCGRPGDPAISCTPSASPAACHAEGRHRAGQV